MNHLKKIFASIAVFGFFSAHASSLLPEDCIQEIDDKVGKILVILDGRFELNGMDASRAGIDRFEIKELPMIRHPEVSRLKFRRFEMYGRFEMKEYRVRATLSYIRNGMCYINGIDLMLLTPYEQTDSAIKYHNDNLYPPKKK
jgi:hypothetical protein